MSVIGYLVGRMADAHAFSAAERPGSSFVAGEAAFAPTLAALASELGPESRLAVVVPTESDASLLAAALAAFSPVAPAALVPAWDTFALERVSPRAESMGARLGALRSLRLREEGGPRILVFSARSAAQRISLAMLDYEPIVLAPGLRIDLEEAAERLARMGYRREYQVESIGEFSIRGSILDVFPADASGPVRADLFGDEIDRLVEFTLSDQRSGAAVAGIEVHPAREFRPLAQHRAAAAELTERYPALAPVFERIAEGELFDGMESFAAFFPDFATGPLSLLAPGDRLVVSEAGRVSERISALVEEEQDLLKAIAPTWQLVEEELGELSLYSDAAALLEGSSVPVSFRSAVPSAGGGEAVDVDRAELADRRDESIVAALRRDSAAGRLTVVSADTVSMANRVIASLREAGLAAKAVHNQDELAALTRTPARSRPVACVLTPLEAGFRSERASLSVYAPFDLTGRRPKRTTARQSARAASALFESLEPGAYVVHDFHGVGMYLGMVRREVDGVERDYLEIEYRDKARLFLPTDQMSVITPYTGGEKPALSRMGGQEWHRTKAKVRKTVERIAQELVLLYQRRMNAEGFAFAPDNPWQAEMEDLFPYTLTRDQAAAVEAVKADMEAARPMDRLLCGDVGFGKTEVALRAAFKAVQSGKQVAVLVPTTLLAHQHHQTFSERFDPFGVRVEVVSRFSGSGEIREVLAGLAAGTVDVVIGTHRLLSKDVRFSQLGLLIVDEEQRFGVNHKEAIKKMSVGVDVLTMSATPIPRTLEMSLTGLRDLSLLTTPPGSRQPILTYVGNYDEATVEEAIRRELLREGQVFFVHNRILDIDTVASRLRQLVPEARIAVAHGQMEGAELERVVDAFWQGETDVLVCTTIIESGIDMPAVNTLVVDRAEWMGLSQLHQLRGRVGRGGIKAYAYLLHAPDTKLTDEAYERLKTIGEAVELGAGFRIAMRDLEIRGAGNLLGRNQSGHIAAVGYDTYVKMVKDAIAYLNGEEAVVRPEVRVDLPVTAAIPSSYVAKDDLRLQAYKELADCFDDQAVDELSEGWEDRFGRIPAETLALIDVTRIRNRAAQAGAAEARAERIGSALGRRLRLRVVGATVPQSALVNFQRRFAKAGYHEHSRTLTLEEAGQESPTRLALEVLDLVLARQNPNAAQHS
ncbi:MAG: transcription-repair coupling factor [Actinomycetota bacterium]|nr:transcription-repair coupling factor [Actinomycetota bacterium]